MFKQFVAYGALALFALTQGSVPPESLVRLDVPDDVQVGGSETMRVSLDVSQMEGTARLWLDISEAALLDFSVTEAAGGRVDKSPASLAIVWDEVGDKSTIEVSIDLIANKAHGKAEVFGAFSFIKDGVRSENPIPRYPIAVVRQGVSELTVTREVKPIDSDHFQVALHVLKGSERGYLGIKEHLPPGFDAEITSSAGASGQVLTGRKMLQYSWINVAPDATDFTVEYTLTRQETGTSWPAFRGFVTAEWRIKDGSSNDLPIRGGEMMDADLPAAPPRRDSLPDNDWVPGGDSIPSDDVIASADPDPIDDASGGGAPGLVYKVQIAAGHEPVKGNYFFKYHGFDGEYHVDNHEGWIKYLEGGHEAYGKATERKNELRGSTQLPGPFVTAYHNGNRITVQEALMLGYQSH